MVYNTAAGGARAAGQTTASAEARNCPPFPTPRPRPALRSYNQFLAEETKRQWTWSKRYAGELVLWKQVPPYLFCEWPPAACCCCLPAVCCCLLLPAAPAHTQA